MKTFQEQFDLLASYNDQKNALLKRHKDKEIDLSTYVGRLNLIDDKIVRDCPDIVVRHGFNTKPKV